MFGWVKRVGVVICEGQVEGWKAGVESIVVGVTVGKEAGMM